MTMEKPKMPRMTRCIKYHPALPWINASRKNSTAQAKRMTDWNLVLPLCWRFSFSSASSFAVCAAEVPAAFFLAAGFFLGAGLEVFLEDADFFANVMCLSERNCPAERRFAVLTAARQRCSAALMFLSDDRAPRWHRGENPSGR